MLVRYASETRKMAGMLLDAQATRSVGLRQVFNDWHAAVTCNVSFWQRRESTPASALSCMAGSVIQSGKLASYSGLLEHSQQHDLYGM